MPLTLGATKMAACGAEVVIFFDPAYGEEFAFRRKRAGHLFSKMRPLSAQLLGYLEGGSLLGISAKHANASPKAGQRLCKRQDARRIFGVEGNMIFALIPLDIQERLKTAGAVFYPGRLLNTDGTDVRLVTAWSTTEAEVDRFVGYLG